MICCVYVSHINQIANITQLTDAVTIVKQCQSTSVSNQNR